MSFKARDMLGLERGDCQGILCDDAIENIVRCYHDVGSIVEEHQVIYGVNTGFGILSGTKISDADTKLLQYKILQSHSVGVGSAVPPDLVRLMLLCKIHALAKGFSGVQIKTIERLLELVEKNIIPVVPEKGSVGASGDLAPLSHLSLPLIGLGEVFYNGIRMTTAEMMQQEAMAPIELGNKEGLALINGTQFILSYAIKGVERLHNCLEAADIIGAMSLEALTGAMSPFDERLHKLRPFRGNLLTARRLRYMLTGSDIMQSHVHCGRVQDPYSLRCMPQVHGASRNAWLHLKQAAEIEINSVTDNPLIFENKETLSGGNFHGQPLALPLDYACMAAAELGNISDRRCYLLLEGKWGLPLLLMKQVGLNSGFMIPQYTTAALVSENKTLCHPASVDSIPTSLGQEDHVSMGSISGRKLNAVLDNLEYILAIELMAACQAIEFRKPLQSSKILSAAHDYIRHFVSFAEEDRIFADDIEAVKKILASGEFVKNCNDFAMKSGIALNDGFEEFDL